MSVVRDYANDNLKKDNKKVQYVSINGETYKVMYTKTFSKWLQWKWHPETTTPPNHDGQECLTIGDHLHQGAGGQGVWPNKNTRAYADKDLAAFDDDGFGFDPDGSGYEAATKSVCSDTWVAKIRSASAGAPLASPIARCGAPDNAPVDLTAAPGDETLTLTWSAPALVVGEDDPISGYKVRWRQVTPMDTAWSAWADTDSESSHDLTGLTNGNAYAAQVQAINSGGVGPPSTVTATPSSPRPAPVVGKVTVSGTDLSAAFRWQGTSPLFVRWTLYRATSKTGSFSAVGKTKDDSESPVSFTNQSRGYWYKLRGRTCEFRTDPGEQVQGSGPSGQQAVDPAPVCGDWSKFSDPVRSKRRHCLSAS